ncbi:MAG: alpha-amylase [Ignavibacteriae bacterium]|nr:alpha-amylase [Ignavibacteriota bacterium]
MRKPLLNDTPTYEFHIAKQIRKKYQIDDSLFSQSGNVVFANFYQVRVLANKMNKLRNIENHISPGELNAIGLIDEIYHLIINKFFRESMPGAFKEVIINLQSSLGKASLNGLLLEFVTIFPPYEVYKGVKSEVEYLNNSTDGKPNTEIILEELLLLRFSNQNLAFHKFKELFDENYFTQKEIYSQALTNMEAFLDKEEYNIGGTKENLFSLLRKPLANNPNNLWEQIEFIKNEWNIFIDEKLLTKIYSSKDLFKESIIFETHAIVGGPPPTIAPQYKGKPQNPAEMFIGKSLYNYVEDSVEDYEEPEQFTPDVNWMPNLVMIAKNIFVWLDQLSKKYKREIKTLDQIPIEEMKQLQKRNINGLWLIGIWERSSASETIKHVMGNTDAVASAYSLYDYTIANDLGGEQAYNIFNEYAKKHGIRLASDMVPNHTGIYSKWMIEHPEYFIQSEHPPFPNYRFTGVNLSAHSDLEIRIEDQYWNKTDAAVVFERKYLPTNETKYFYHGNDGTVMPWNDTAQLDLLKEEVREAIIQKIFDVARKFSVIRFDAAMTLAKKHFSRLWYPQPGKGGDIASRADHALTKKQFDEFFPKEFWREVVDRINTEMPETLLLAEAFWLMEGYFVRTLGMHRVYNSAFMHMMMKEENDKYRELITNTLEFEPEILKRYVNFMSNPDEETAIEQFGTGDKYFAVLVLLCTLPGLPMLAHGQIEGYTEKYGMEYKRAYYDEQPNQWLVEKHEKEIFPLLSKRHLFSEIEQFWLFDFINSNGNLNENIYAYTNASNNEKALVFVNNKYEKVKGFINHSRQKLVTNNNAKNLTNVTIAESLNFKNEENYFYIAKNVITGLEFIFKGTHIHSSGLRFSLDEYEYKVLIGFREIYDSSGETNLFYKKLKGKGVPNFEKERDEFKLTVVHHLFTNIFNEENINKLNEITFLNSSNNTKDTELIDNITKDFEDFIVETKNHFNLKVDEEDISNNFRNELNTIEYLSKIIQKSYSKDRPKKNIAIRNVISIISKNDQNLKLSFVYLVIKQVRELFNSNTKTNKNGLSELLLATPVRNILNGNNSSSLDATHYISLINLLLNVDLFLTTASIKYNKFDKLTTKKEIVQYFVKYKKDLVKNIFNNDFAKTYLEVNTFEDTVFYSKQRFDELLDWIMTLSLMNYIQIQQKGKRVKPKSKIINFTNNLFILNSNLKTTSDKCGYKFDLMKDEFSISSTKKAAKQKMPGT